MRPMIPLFLLLSSTMPVWGGDLPFKYTSADGNYSVNFPEEPTRATKELATAAGILRVVTDRVDVNRSYLLSVSYTDFPKEFAHLPAKKLLEAAKSGLKGRDGKISEDKEIEFSGNKYPGREVFVDTPKYCVRVRMILVGTRMYQIMVNGDKKYVQSKDADELFASFELLK